MYKSGYTMMIFEDLEREVVKFLENISIEYYPNPKERENIYSPMLANILINIGSRVDEFFRNWNIVKIYQRKKTLQLKNWIFGIIDLQRQKIYLL